MKKPNESGLHIIKDDKEEDHGLRAYVCPACGNTDEDLIKSFPYKTSSTEVRCWGGFGVKTYRYTPHKCNSCCCNFVAWESSKKVNGSVVGSLLVIAVLTAILSMSIVVSICVEPLVFIICAIVTFFIIAICIYIDDSTPGPDKGPSVIDKNIDHDLYEEEDDGDNYDIDSSLCGDIHNNLNTSMLQCNSSIQMEMLKNQLANMTNAIWKI